MYLIIAIKNIIKHYKRSLVVLIATALTVCTLSIISGLIDGVVENFYSSTIEESGHLRIRSQAASNALKRFDLNLLVQDSNDTDLIVKNGVLQAGTELKSREGVLDFTALLIEASENDQDEARNVPLLFHGTTSKTTYWHSVTQGMQSGQFLDSEQGIVISVAVANILAKNLGEKILVLVKDLDGNPWYEELTITGIFQTASVQWDETNAFMTLSKAQEMLNVPNQVSEIRYQIQDRDTADSCLDKTRILLSNAMPELQIENWRGINQTTLSLLSRLQVGSWFIQILFLIVSCSIITNTVLMSVFERIREYGTLRAIGLRRRDLKRLILTETSCLGIIGSLVGIALGIVIIVSVAKTGVDLGAIMESFGLERNNYPIISISTVLINLSCGILIAIISSWYASRIVARLAIADALSHS